VKSTAAKFAGGRQHRVIPNVGHNLPEENPTAFAAAVWELASKTRRGDGWGGVRRSGNAARRAPTVRESVPSRQGRAGLGEYVLIKYARRRRFLRLLRIARIAADGLKQKLDAEAVSYAIPGALWVAAEDIERRQSELPRDREIILYCT